MKRKWKELKGIPLWLVVLVMIATISTVYAVYTWNMHVEWEVKDTTIGIYMDPDCLIPWEHTLTLPPVEGSETRDFYIKNEGNLAIDVTIINEEIVGATQLWSPSSLTNLVVGGKEHMILTLTFTEDGYYDFDFSSSVHV